MMRIKMVPYSPLSNSARNLAEALGIQRVRLANTTYLPRGDDLVINWGRTSCPFNVDIPRIMNHPVNVALATDKVKCLTTLRAGGVPTVDFTTDRDVAVSWITGGGVVYCRTLITSTQGRGIVVATTIEELVDAPLYTLSPGTCREYRMHVGFEDIILLQQKVRRSSCPEASSLIKNHANGWVFAHRNIRRPSPLCQLAAVDAVRVLGLSFGAVDVATRGDRPYVLEVNTAPGLEGTTLQKYHDFFREFINTLTHDEDEEDVDPREYDDEEE